MLLEVGRGLYKLHNEKLRNLHNIITLRKINVIEMEETSSW
jgi:hypothetical protein